MQQTLDNKFYIEIDNHQTNHKDEQICGDVVMTRRIKEENRTIMVLSDGMGHGVKANVLASLTASMLMNFTTDHSDIRKAAEIVMDTLPICSVRKISYATFSIIDIEYDGTTNIVEYDNPQCMIMRGTEPYDPGWKEIALESPRHKGKVIRSCTFKPRKEDRILTWSDGIRQSGMGSKEYPFGWGQENVENFVHGLVKYMPYISASKLSQKVVNKANMNDKGNPKDDNTCSIIYFREPRKLLLCTGPPFEEDRDLELAMKVHRFQGKKIIAGGTTAEIVARELGLKISPGMEIEDPELPPVSKMENMNLVTEGILTIGKVAKILEQNDNDYKPGKGPADRIVKMLMESDKIHIINGTKINMAHQDPSLPMELEIRRSIVKKIVKLLEDKFLKEVELQYI